MPLETLTDVCDIPVFVLCGGKGKRTGSQLSNIPKPLLRYRGRPLFSYVTEWFASSGLSRIYLVVESRHLNAFERAIAECKQAFDWPTVETTAERDHSSIGAKVLHILDNHWPRFFLAFSDIVCNADLMEMFQHHVTTQRCLTMLVVPCHLPFGIVELDNRTDLVARFEEKPVLSDILVNGGVFLVEHSTLEYIERDHCQADFAAGFLEVLVKSEQVAAYVHRGLYITTEDLTTRL